MRGQWINIGLCREILWVDMSSQDFHTKQLEQEEFQKSGLTQSEIFDMRDVRLKFQPGQVFAIQMGVI